MLATEENFFVFLKIIMDKDDLECIGKIAKTKGLKGEVFVQLRIDSFENLEASKIFYLEMNKKFIPFFCTMASIKQTKLLLALDEIQTVEQAQKLVNIPVYLPKSIFPEPSDELLYTDLEGFLVIDANSGELGILEEVLEYPQQFIARLVYKNKELLFPLNEELITRIDEEAKKLYVDLPDGLISIYID